MRLLQPAGCKKIQLFTSFIIKTIIPAKSLLRIVIFQKKVWIFEIVMKGIKFATEKDP